MSPDQDLAADRSLLGRTSTVERLADILRSRITEGFFAPGERLAEDAIGTALGVSRNTLREAFRLLTHEKLLVHKLNQGVFVRRLDVADVVDLYHVRRVVEGAAVRAVRTLSTADARRLVEGALDGMAANEAGGRLWPGDDSPPMPRYVAAAIAQPSQTCGSV